MRRRLASTSVSIVITFDLELQNWTVCISSLLERHLQVCSLSAAARMLASPPGPKKNTPASDLLTSTHPRKSSSVSNILRLLTARPCSPSPTAVVSTTGQGCRRADLRVAELAALGVGANRARTALVDVAALRASTQRAVGVTVCARRVRRERERELGGHGHGVEDDPGRGGWNRSV